MVLSGKFSIDQFIDVFRGIDGQILRLHQCSSEDFLGLNADFKEYFKQSKLIAANALDIFNSLTTDESEGLLTDIEAFYKTINRIQSEFTMNLNNTISRLTKMLELLDKLYFPLKNLTQDLLTLEILLANLKILTSANPAFTEEVERKLLQFTSIIDAFKSYNQRSVLDFEKLKSEIKGMLSQFENIRSSSVKDLDLVLNNVHLGIILFAEKHEEASRLIPRLRVQTDGTSKSIADIITNLQYHDIIRQKMEHVHDTHKKLLIELEETARVTNTSGVDNQGKLMMKIRDVANLQSAQLVYANKEYQKAIEIITNKFMEIGDDMTHIASMCQEIYVSQDNSGEIHMEEFIHKLHTSADVLRRFVSATEAYAHQVHQFQSNINQVSVGLDEFSKSVFSLKDQFVSTCKHFTEAELSNGESDEALKRIQQLYKDMEGIENLITDVFAQVESISQSLTQGTSESVVGMRETNLITDVAESMSHILEQLNEKHNKIVSLLSTSIGLSTNIRKEISISIGKVKYYDFFEKVIVAIIQQFNQIYDLLKREFVIEQSENFDEVKRSYTMASEHKVHDQVSLGLTNEEEIELFDEDDDNLELF